MPKSDVILESPPKNRDELIEAVEKALDKADYQFLKIAFEQQLIFCHSDADVYALVQDYVVLAKS